MSGMTWAESCGPAWVEAGSGYLPEDFDVGFVFCRSTLHCHVWTTFDPSLQPSPGRGEGDGGASVMPVGPFVIPTGPPLSCPLVSLCHSRRLLTGIQCFAFLSLIRVTPHGKAMDSRLIMSGMTEGRLNTWGMTECLLWPPLSCPCNPSPTRGREARSPGCQLFDLEAAFRCLSV